MDIIVTTPKSEMANAAQEAADCRAAGGGEYFRRFPFGMGPTNIKFGDRVFYCEDGFIRGYAVVHKIRRLDVDVVCDTTGRSWAPGLYVFMDAASWRWVKPIPMTGFQGYRYAERFAWVNELVDMGGWLDPRPEVTRD